MAAECIGSSLRGEFNEKPSFCIAAVSAWLHLGTQTAHGSLNSFYTNTPIKLYIHPSNTSNADHSGLTDTPATTRGDGYIKTVDSAGPGLAYRQARPWPDQYFGKANVFNVQAPTNLTNPKILPPLM